MNCFHCGQCCNQPIEVTPEELEVMKQAGTPRQNEKLEATRVYDGHYIIEPPCPYRGCDCSIYVCRPLVCRLYTCWRSSIEQGINPERVNDPEYQKEKQLLLEKNREWANSNGWDV
jgi:Fe-S-cluster containining protein